MAGAAGPASGGQGRPIRRIADAILLLALLGGPLLAAETWARRHLDLVYPYLTDRLHWVETKLWLIEQAGCPEVLALGSSVTNRTIVSEYVVGESMPIGGRLGPVERVFSFGLDGGRATVLYGVWRRIHARGCVPAYVIVEVLPEVINQHQAWRGYYQPLIDLGTLWALPRGFAAGVGLDTTALFRLLTWDRLTLSRLRVAFASALVERAGLSAFSGSTSPPALDGMLAPLSDGSLLDVGLARERAQRRRELREGLYPFRPSDIEVETLLQLVDEVRASGSTLILHTPPVTPLYRKHIEERQRSTGSETVPALRERILGRIGAREAGSAWYWCYEGPGYGPADFEDWIHLNRKGGRRYVRELFSALGARRRGDGACPGLL